MKKVLVVALAVMAFAAYAYCEENKAVNKSPFAFIQGFFMGDEYVQYQSDLAKIEDSYKKGEISKEKYLEMKSDAETNYKSKH
jgi:hypothetical protein